MKEAICFNIYRNFFKYVTFPYVDKNGKLHKKGGDDPDYSKALKVLNKMVADAIKNKELEFTYKGKRVEIDLPIEERQTGNIFGDYDGNESSYWEGVYIYCTLPIEPEDFDPKKLKVKNRPDGFVPEWRSTY